MGLTMISENEKIGFVILHYQLSELTMNCVESVLKYVPNAFILIVDNCSPNRSGALLAKKYKDNSNVCCLLLNENMGFAKGNNEGYAYLKRLKNFDYICCINNDTLLVQPDFASVIRNEYKKSHFAVMAPLALQKNGSVQRFAPTLKALNEYKYELERFETHSNRRSYMRSLDIKTRFLLQMPRLSSWVGKLKQLLVCPYKKRMEDVVLHGCFLIFSKNYIDQFDTAFNDRTFMYREEELLYLRIKKHGLRSVYSPDLMIYHMENASTNSTYSQKEEKYQFIRKNQIHSLRLLIEEMEQYQ